MGQYTRIFAERLLANHTPENVAALLNRSVEGSSVTIEEIRAIADGLTGKKIDRPKATDAQIRHAAKNRGMNETARHLRAQGYQVNESRVSTIIARMIAQGERRKMQTSGQPVQQELRITRARAKASCDAMLRRHLQTGQHWITDPAVFAERCASVGLSV